MMNVLPKVDFNSLARRHPERSRISGEARDLPQNSSALIATAAKPATKSGTDNWPLPAANWTNQ
jgi:hypothetical protein